MKNDSSTDGLLAEINMQSC